MPFAALAFSAVNSGPVYPVARVIPLSMKQHTHGWCRAVVCVCL